MHTRMYNFIKFYAPGARLDDPRSASGRSIDELCQVLGKGRLEIIPLLVEWSEPLGLTIDKGNVIIDQPGLDEVIKYLDEQFGEWSRSVRASAGKIVQKLL